MRGLEQRPWCDKTLEALGCLARCFKLLGEQQVEWMSGRVQEYLARLLELAIPEGLNAISDPSFRVLLQAHSARRS